MASLPLAVALAAPGAAAPPPSPPPPACCAFICVTEKMKRPSSDSRLTEPCVSVIRPPSASGLSAPPGTSETYFPPSSPSEVISAEVSEGRRSVRSTRSVTSAPKVAGSMRLSVTLPTFTPAIRTSAPFASPSIRSNRAVSRMPSAPPPPRPLCSTA